MPSRPSLSPPHAPSPSLRRIYEREAVRGMVPHTLLNVLAEYLLSQGVKPASVMPAAALRADAQQLGRFPAEAYCLCLLRAAERLDDPLLGLHLGRTIRPSHLGAMGYLLQNCENLGAALQRIQRYHRLLHDINPIGHAVEGDTLVLQWGTSRGRPGALFDEAGITAIVEFSRALCGRPLPLLAVDFVNPAPQRRKPFGDYYGCPVRWSQPVTRLVLPLSHLGTPLRQHDPVLRRLMEEQVDAALAELPGDGDLAALTRSVVANLARQGMPGLEQVAAELQVSPRVLYRRLAAQGLNFRELRDGALRQLAETHLQDSRLSIADVALLLGYTEQSAFTRAFRRWSGTTPLAWRQQARG